MSSSYVITSNSLENDLDLSDSVKRDLRKFQTISNNCKTKLIFNKIINDSNIPIRSNNIFRNPLLIEELGRVKCFVDYEDQIDIDIVHAEMCQCDGKCKCFAKQLKKKISIHELDREFYKTD